MYISFDLGGSSLKYGLGNTREGLLKHGSVRLRGVSRDAIINLIDDTFVELNAHLPTGESLHGVSLGSPGVVDAAGGRVLSHCPNLPDWKGAEPGPVLQRRLGVPVFVDNDANLMAYGEAARFGFERTVLGITLGTGIGSGLVVGRDIYTGAGWAALELGHVLVAPDGRLCGCGRRGCIEAYASGPSLVALCREAWRQKHDGRVNDSDNPTVKQIFDNVVDNKEVCAILLHQMDRLGFVLANAITILAPDVLIIGGGLSEISSFPWVELERAVRDRLLPVHNGSLRFEQAQLGNRAAIVGGLWRCHHRLESDIDN
ncbi:MAG: ROK family protein [Candidatus Cloacimonetes bacterium]|nr:ROK family protein [Candidatus Cloacimonadota bacterium]